MCPNTPRLFPPPHHCRLLHARPNPRQARGYAYLREHEYTQAIADFTSAIRLNLKYANAYLNRSVARKLAGDAEGAKGDLKMAHVLTAEAQASPKPVKAE